MLIKLRSRALRLGLVAVAIVTVGAAAYWLAYFNIQNQMRTTYLATHDDALHAEMSTVELVESIVRSAELMDDANDNLREALAAKEEEIAELKKKVFFYRKILSPDEAEEGLSIVSAKLDKPDADDRFPFEIILRKIDRLDTLVTGKVELVLSEGDGESARSIKAKNFYKGDTQFSFKYFQKLRGVLAVPKGFDPVKVTARVVPSKGKPLEAAWYWGDLLKGSHALQW